MKLSKGKLIVLIGLLCAGCVSQPLRIPSVANRHFEELGPGEGSATGLMLFDVIPIGQNERFVRAYDAAVASRKGDALINPEITERWFWGYVLNGYITEIRGTVIKYSDQK